MFQPARMDQVNILALDSDVDRLTFEIVKLGIFHPISISEIEDWADELESIETETALASLTNLERKIRSISSKLAFVPKIMMRDVALEKVDVESADKKLGSIEEEVESTFKAKKTAEEEVERLNIFLGQAKPFVPVRFPIDTRLRYSFLEVTVGKITQKNLDVLRKELEGIPNVIIPYRAEAGEIIVLVIVLKRDRAVLDKALREVSFEKVEEPGKVEGISPEMAEQVKEQIKGFEKEIEEVDRKLRIKREEYKSVLEEILVKIRVNQIVLRAKGYFKKTHRTYLISGWVPEKDQKKLTEQVRKVTKGRCYVEALRPEQVSGYRTGEADVPVLFRNPGFLKPFELLISNYDIPAYNAIDPTFFFAVTFLLMFGVMFGDVGQGALLAVLGAYIATRKALSIGIRRIGSLLVYCGISSVVFGFLYGSFFGFENLLPTIWIKPMENILYFFRVAIFFGVVLVSLGIILNIINAIRGRDLLGGIFDKTGIIGGIIYWIGVGIVIKIFLRQTQINPQVILLLLGIPIAMFFLKEPIRKIFYPREKLFYEGIFTYFMEKLVELLEIFAGYLANTISFIRVAAFALSHVGLFLAIFSLSNAIRDAGGSIIWQVIVHIVGNALIICLEGLIISVQSMRLEYYEFFGKFFKGGGKKFEPMDLMKLERAGGGS